MHEWRSIQDIQVIVRTLETKKNVSYVETLICHRFKYDGPFAFSVFIIALPNNQTIFPFVMHAIQGSKHTGKSIHVPCLFPTAKGNLSRWVASSDTSQILHALQYKTASCTPWLWTH